MSAPTSSVTSRETAPRTRIGDYFSLVRFSHSIFALPFALQGAWLAARGVPTMCTLCWIVVCAVAARTAAMGFNRLVDRKLDAHNPRTRAREIPAGRVSARSAALLSLAASVVFVAAAFALHDLAGMLSPLVLAVVLGYSFVKRFSFLAHVVLGVALALAPLGAWVAVRGEISGDPWLLGSLALAVASWVFGFDLIYACQDAEHDRRSGLHSIPARFGIARALHVSSAAHVVTLAALIGVGVRAELGWIYFSAVALSAVLLWWEHKLVSPHDLSRVDVAFFTLNGWIGVALFVALALDLAWVSAV